MQVNSFYFFTFIKPINMDFYFQLDDSLIVAIKQSELGPLFSYGLDSLGRQLMSANSIETFNGQIYDAVIDRNLSLTLIMTDETLSPVTWERAASAADGKK